MSSMQVFDGSGKDVPAHDVLDLHCGNHWITQDEQIVITDIHPDFVGTLVTLKSLDRLVREQRNKNLPRLERVVFVNGQKLHRYTIIDIVFFDHENTATIEVRLA